MAQHTPQASRKNIVILGGSYGGASTTHYLLKHVIPRLPDKGSYQVVLVNPSVQGMCRPACPRALISDDMFPQDKLFFSISKVFGQYPENIFRFVHGTATELDHTNRTCCVNLSASNAVEKIEFHALVIATGASTPSPLHGLNRDESFLRSNWTAFRKALPATKSIVIVGGGPTGVETAGELGEYLNGRANWFSSKLAAPKVAITIVTAGSQILPALRPTIAAQAESYLAKVGVSVIKNARVNTISPADAGTDTALTSKTTLTLSTGQTLHADLYIPATGTKPNTSFVTDKSLLADDGRVKTNPSTLRVDAASVGPGALIYAIGDVATAFRPAIHLILPAIPVLCANIKRDLLLTSGADNTAVEYPDREYKEDRRETQMVPIGRRKGVGAAMGWRLPSWVVWAVKGRDYWLWTTGGLWSGRQWVKEA